MAEEALQVVTSTSVAFLGSKSGFEALPSSLRKSGWSVVDVTNVQEATKNSKTICVTADDPDSFRALVFPNPNSMIQDKLLLSFGRQSAHSSQVLEFDSVMRGGNSSDVAILDQMRNPSDKPVVLYGIINREAAAFIRPLLATLGSPMHSGLPGSASAVRVSVNVARGIQAIGLASAIAFCESYGVPLNALETSLRSSMLWAKCFDSLFPAMASSGPKGSAPQRSPYNLKFMVGEMDDMFHELSFMRPMDAHIIDSARAVAHNAIASSSSSSHCATIVDMMRKGLQNQYFSEQGVSNGNGQMKNSSNGTSSVADASQELVIVVDDKNQVVGTVPRAEMRSKNLPHRATYILVFNSKGELFVHQRTATKDVFPGCFDPTCGGVVVAEDKSVEDAAYRELHEELGIEGVPLKYLCETVYQDGAMVVFGACFSCVYDGPLKLQPEEIQSGSFMPIDEILAHSQKEPYIPDGMMVLMKYLEQGQFPDDTAQATIAVIGLGVLGGPIAERLAKTGHQVVAYNRTPSKSEVLRQYGARVARDAASAIQESSVVVTVLPDAQTIKEVLLNATTSQSLRGKTFIQMGTVGPEESREIERLVLEAGAREFLEAPVFGSGVQAKEGRLLVMVGALEKSAYYRNLNIFSSISRQPLLVGSVGAASALAVSMSQLLACSTFGYSIGHAWNTWQKLDWQLSVSVMRSMDIHSECFELVIDKFLERQFEPVVLPVRHLLRDVNVFVEAGQARGLDVSLQSTMRMIISRGVDNGIGDSDFSSLHTEVAPRPFPRVSFIRD